jgi:thymidine kinase
MGRPAVEVSPTTDLWEVVRAAVPDGGFVVADEAQFYAPEQVDQLARCVDERDIEVACFGLLSDFAGRMFPGSARLVEMADVLVPLPLPVVCWCGRPARINARLVDGEVVHEGEQVVLGDTAPTGGALFGPEVRYQVLCRRHWRSKKACASGGAAAR